MQRALIFKILAIVVFMVFLSITLLLIGGVINERQYYKERVIRDISSSWTSTQNITPAILVTPYNETKYIEEKQVIDGVLQTTRKKHETLRRLYHVPEELEITGEIQTSERYRGIYKVPVYTADLTFKGQFSLEQNNAIENDDETKIEWLEPFVVFGVSDIRGINRNIQLRVNNKDVELTPGTRSFYIEQGMSGEFSLNYEKDQKVDFTAKINLNGMKSLSFVPTGKFTTVHLTSPWKHPSFMGRYLPAEREISEEGFKAKWETTYFATNFKDQLQKCYQNDRCGGLEANNFGVAFFEGIDVYVQSERALKYGIMFVVLTFVVFFVFEVLRNLRIHPIQYALVGFAMMIFYLLLISLSEQIAFIASYLIASLACILLLTFYVSYILKSIKRALVFGFILTGLYGALYMILRSEDYALLMGSLLLFGAMAFIMILTRHIDWYQIGNSSKKSSDS